MNSNDPAVLDRIKKAEDTLREKPYNLDAWSILIRHAQSLDIRKARRVYESLLKHFPTSGRYWKIYIDHEMKARNYDHVERLFKRCLNTVLNVDLWKSYINYIKDQKANQIRNEPRINLDGTQRADPVQAIREQIVRAYDFALDKIGNDIHSYQIWTEYLEYLKTAPPPKSNNPAQQNNNSDPAFSEGLRTTAVRKIYKKAVVTPLLQLEGIWRDYCAWEQQVLGQHGKKEYEIVQREYLIAKRVARELDQLTRGLNRNAPALPPSGGHSNDEKRQVELWRKIIEWEKCNNSKSSEATILVKRVIFSYEQCLQCMAHHPGFWFECAEYMHSAMNGFDAKDSSTVVSELKGQIIKLFERVMQDDSPVRSSQLLHFWYAEFLEKQRMFEQANRVYQRLYQNTIGGGPIIVPGKTEKDIKILNHDPNDPNSISPLTSLTPIPILDPTLSYIQHMKYARRIEGIKSARAIFKKARADYRVRYQVYVFAAKMEYTCTKDMNVAQKIFELGLKKFKKDPEFLQQYTKFMRMLNETNNTRVLYERVLNESHDKGVVVDPLNGPQLNGSSGDPSQNGTLKTISGVEIRQDPSSDPSKNGENRHLSSQSTKFLWNDYMNFETIVGDLGSIGGIETRMLCNTIASDAYLLTDPFKLANKEKAVQNHHQTMLKPTLEQPTSGRIQSQPFNAATQRLEQEINNLKTDNTFNRSDVIQRYKSALRIGRYKFLDLNPCGDGELKSVGIDDKSITELGNGLKQSQDAAKANAEDYFWGFEKISLITILRNLLLKDLIKNLFPMNPKTLKPPLSTTKNPTPPPGA